MLTGVKWHAAVVDVDCPGLNFEEVVAALTGGSVLILGTDTLPGFHVRADHHEGVQRIRAIKGRDPHKPMLVLAGSLEQIRKFVAPLTPLQQDICRRCWPGPFTLVLPGSGLLAPGIESETGGLAARVPDHPLLQKLILAIGAPLVSTSVNRIGEVPCATIAEAVSVLGSLADGFWDFEDASSERSVEPSALVDLTGSQPMTLRRGPRPFPPAPNAT